MNTNPIILASQSPRRKSLLLEAGLNFSIIPSNVDEYKLEKCEPEKYVKILAEAKAQDIAKQNPGSWVIGADTIVLINNDILGKPSSKEDAYSMLKRLSGNSHKVLTGFCICCMDRNRLYAETVTSNVIFKNLTETEINWYLETGEPFDKAGAYAVQGLGSFFIKKINGSYTNVVGLPICELMDFLIKENIVIL
ncbi:MAG: septum formation inhibitor Maf [Desulfobacterales bacterium]|nr:septum formation inhibitor Maf [Desulfobacterales bacterium]